MSQFQPLCKASHISFRSVDVSELTRCATSPLLIAVPFERSRVLATAAIPVPCMAGKMILLVIMLYDHYALHLIVLLIFLYNIMREQSKNQVAHHNMAET